MIYRIVCDGVDIYGDTVETSVLKPHLDIELNSAGSLEFTLPKDNEDAWNMIKVFQNEIEVWENDEIIWFGRPLQITRDWNNQKKVVCEGALAYFNDTIERTNEIFPNSQHTNTIHSFFRHLIDSYNSQIEISSGGSIGEGKSFEVGELDIPNVDVYRFTDYQTTFECLQQMCLDTNGGYFILRKVYNGPDSEHPYTRYIDWYETMPYGSTQDVEFGINLLDYSNDLNGADICTVLIPTGEDNLKLNSLGNKNPDTDVNRGVGHKSGSDEIWYEPGVQVYGRVVNQHSFNDYSSVDALWAKARDWLVNKNTDIPTIEVDAADLHYIKEYSEFKGNFKVGMNVQVISGPHDMNQSLVIYKLSMDLDTGTKKVTLGTPPKKELTDIVAPSSGRKTTRGKGGDKPGDEVVVKVEDVFPIRVKQPGSDHYTSAVSNGVAYIDLTNTGGGDVRDVTVDGESIVDPETKIANLDSSEFGTPVVANPVETATDDLTKVQIGDTVYDIPGGGGGGGGQQYTCDLLFVNDPLPSPTSGTGNVDRTYTLSKSIDDYDAVVIFGYGFTSSSIAGSNIVTQFVLKDDFYSAGADGTGYLINGSKDDAGRRLVMKFTDNTTITTRAMRTESGIEPMLYKVYGLKFAASVIHHPVAMESYYDTEEQEIGRWIDGKPLYQKTIYVPSLFKDNDVAIADEPENLDELINIKTIFKIPDGGTLARVASNYYGANNDQYRDYNYQGKIYLAIYTTRSAAVMANSKAWTTIQYTKTTDAVGTGVPKTKLISRSDLYSENERIIGRWTDGKPLYQKTWDINVSAPSANTWYSTGILLADYDVDTIVDGEVVDIYNQSIPSVVGTINDTHFGVNTYVPNRTITKLTARYTKTTDLPGTGVVPEDPQFVYLSDYYSEEEQEIGRWTDGKPLYQKTEHIVLTNPVEPQSDTTIQLSELQNRDKLFYTSVIGGFYGTASTISNWTQFITDANPNSASAAAVKSYADDQVIIWVGSNHGNFPQVSTDNRYRELYITRQYTKTTDAPGTGAPKGRLVSSSEIYSENERMIGRWIDGKPLYQKSISFNNTSDSYLEIDVADLSIDRLTNTELSYMFSGGNDNYKGSGIYYYTSSDLIRAYVYSNTNKLVLVRGNDYPITSDGIVTIQYTKTNDNPGSGILPEDPQFVYMSDYYSEEERVVGRWTDGKPVYQKTVKYFGNYSGSGSLALGIQNIDQMADIKAMGYDGGDGWMALSQAHSNSSYARGFFYNKTTNSMEYRFGTGTGAEIVTIIATLQYTKTTDLPNSGPTPGNLIYLPSIYSEQERQVGVWTDGKPLYQKTFITTPSSASYDIDVSSLNIEKMISRSGVLTRTISGDNIQQKDVEYRTETSTYNTYGVVVELRNSNLYVDISGYSYNEISEVRITIQYTKTTDQPGSGTWTPEGQLAHHYSTSEKIVGTWIDGSTLWEKVITGFSVTLQSGVLKDTGVNVSYISNVISVSALGDDGVSVIPVAGYKINNTLQMLGYQTGNVINKCIIQYTKSS